MTRISAAENLSIDIQPERWRLYLNGDTQERVLIEAAPGRALRYTSSFADRRRLPIGTLPNIAIKQVILGWSPGDSMWHLGLLLTPEIAQERGSRWCELARWYDPTAREFAIDAERAGRSLADTLEQPFRLIPPATERPTAAPLRDLPALPLKFGIWSLQRDGESLQFVRASKWANTRIVRIAWYSFWTMVYIVLSVATLTTKLALPNSGTMLPNPAVLPFLGLGTAAILLIIILSTLYSLFTRPDRIVVAPTTKTITGQSGENRRWHKAADEIIAVYVTQVIGQRGRKRTIHHGEINLQIGERRFQNVVVQDQEEERFQKSDTEAKPKEQITELTPDDVDTDLQAAALYIAVALGGLACYYDQRVQ